jgi:nitroreductase
MDAYECIVGRVEVREFTREPVPEAVVRRVLEAGRLAPSQRNRQQWHFIVVQDRELLRQVAEAAPTGPYIVDAGFAVVIAMDGAKMPQVDAARAAQSMQLAAWAEGLGSCWVSGLDRDRIKTILRMPLALEVVTVLPFGRPTPAAGAVRKRRKPLAEIAHRNRFGTPYA